MTQTATSILTESQDFYSQGIRCGATLYRPANVSLPPIIVMAHGFGATQDGGLPAYANHFAEHGLATLTFDYRHFGKSAGEPRQLLNVQKQIDDWHAAIEFVRSLKQIDSSRLALWGTSFAGGHVLTVAASEHNLKAVVSQVPFVDGLASINLNHQTAKLIGTGILDVGKHCLGLPPQKIRIVGPPNSLSAMIAGNAEAGYMALVEHSKEWKNEVLARIILTVPTYRPAKSVKKIQAPVLYLIAKNDQITPAKPAIKACQNTPNSELIMLDGGHFDPYVAPLFESVVNAQTDFLKKHLL